jgi:hypothetical protein
MEAAMSRPDPVNRRERRVVAGGAFVVVVALLLAYAVVPFVRHWTAREAEIAVVRDRLTYLETLTARAGAIEQSAAAAERQLSSETRRVVHARSATLAASALQSLLQDMADASALAVSRLEVSADDTVATETLASGGGAPDADAAAEAARPSVGLQIPATISAYGDIHGVARFFDLLGGGPRVLVLERLAVQRNAALLGAPDVVQFTATLRAPVLPE